MGASKEQQKAILRACGRHIRKQLAPIQKQLLELQRKGMADASPDRSRNYTKELVINDAFKSRYRYDPSDGTWNLVR